MVSTNNRNQVFRPRHHSHSPHRQRSSSPARKNNIPRPPPKIITTTTTKNNNNNNNNQKKKMASRCSTNDNTRTSASYDELAWLRDVEQSKDSNGKLLLKSLYHSEHSAQLNADDDELIQQLESFLKSSKGSKNVIKEIHNILSSSIFSTMMDISIMLDGQMKGKLMHEIIGQLDVKIKRSVAKISFICNQVLYNILTSNSRKWRKHQEAIVEMCCAVLYSLPGKIEALPHHDTDVKKLIKHFKAKHFLGQVSLYLWKDIFCEHHIQVEAQIVVPILRRLAMLDLLDENWNIIGSFEEILCHVEEQCNLGIGRSPADAALDQMSLHLRNGRESMRLKQVYLSQLWTSAANEIPQCWELQRKCSAPMCSNVETADKPHRLRCNKCYYFHWCSPACKEYCTSVTNIHQSSCAATPNSKAIFLREQADLFLAMYDGEDEDNFQSHCSACGSHVKAIAITLKQCSHCKTVSYCSKACQQWDWIHGGHRHVCKRIVEERNTLSEKRSEI